MIRLAVVDDHPLVLDGLRAALADVDGIQLVASPATVADARAVLDDDLDVVICDIRLGNESGFQLLAEAAGRDRSPAFLMISSFDSPQYVYAAQRLGAAGFLLKTAPTTEILDAVLRIAAGGSAYDVRLMRSRAWRPLTKREHDVLSGVVDGRSNDEIGSDLGVSRKTVEVYLSRLFARSGAQSRTELAVLAERERWLDVPPVPPVRGPE